jgi:hypothetical protein
VSFDPSDSRLLQLAFENISLGFEGSQLSQKVRLPEVGRH